MTGIGTRKTDITGRATGRRFGNKRTSIGEQFAPHPIRMIRSPAWCALSLSARRVLDRIKIELASHGGTDNGKLPCTYDDLQRCGIHRHAIGPAIREAAALGFLEVTEPGRAGNADWRKPNVFRLTYRNTQNAKPTDEWALISTDEEAVEIARAARTTPAPKTDYQCRKTPNLGGGNRHRKPPIHSTETDTTGHSTETITTLDISGGVQPSHTGPGMGHNAGPPLDDLNIPPFLRRGHPDCAVREGTA
jgi:hypothetical protein